LNRTPDAFDTEDDAAAWLVRLDADASAATLALWQEWLREDDRHRAAFVRVEEGWRQAECLKSLRPIDGAVKPDLLDSVPRAPSRSRRGVADVTRAAFGRGLYTSVAVALGASAVAGLLVLAGWRFLAQPDHRVHETERGGFERVVLPDGSTASLNTNSEIRVHFTHERREVVLTRGEALFSVARDTLRPFEVDVGGNAVRALATSFSVRLRAAGQVEVLVLQGGVAVDKPQPTGAASLLSAGDDAMIDTEGRARIEKVDAPGISHKLAWIHGEIWFQHCALSEAVAEFNRYNSRQFVLTDPALAQLHIGGSFATTDPAAFMAALEHVFGIRPLPPRPDAFGTEVIQLVASRPGATSH
jgi:transmembrane sensor